MNDGPRMIPGFTIRGSYSIVPTEPIKVGSERQLLMDDHVVEDCWHCRRTVHSPTKHPANPLIVPTASCEGSGPAYLNCFYDEHTACFRMWATCSSAPKSAPFARRGVYYESKDGIQWQAPNLGLFEYEGSADNNIFWGHERYIFDNLTVMPMPANKRERGRYVMLYNRGTLDPQERQTAPAMGMQVRIAFSDDGIQFRDQEENPVIVGRSDTHNNLVYNPQRDVFMHYRRATINAHEIRRIAYSESADLIQWTQPRSIVVPDELDPPMLYGMTVDRYQGVYFGFLQMFYCDDRLRLDKDLMLDCQLAWSRDGITWHRHPQRPIFLPCGHVGTYDWGMVRVGTTIIERGDQLYLYYSGANRLHTQMPGTWSACLATLRKDGFVSLDATDVGYMLTKPIECPGGNLHINAKTGTGGYIRVAIRRGDGEFDGEWLPEWSYDAGKVFAGDSTNYIVNWQGQEGVEPLKGKSIRLHFWMRNAELYSFWFQ